METHRFDGQDGERPVRPVARSIRRGFQCRCPNCGRGKLFAAFARTVDRCSACGEEIHHHRADDFPAYLVIFVVGHIVVGAFMGTQALFALSTAMHLAIWTPVTIALAILLLQPMKGAAVGLQWALYMHGFGGEADRIESHPEL